MTGTRIEAVQMPSPILLNLNLPFRSGDDDVARGMRAFACREGSRDDERRVLAAVGALAHWKLKQSQREKREIQYLVL